MTFSTPRAVLPPRETKRAPLSLSTVDEAGVFEGYASLFNIIDLGKDMVMPGAFRDSLAGRGVASVKMLWQHSASQPIGKWLSITEDAKGLHVRGKLNLAVARARDVHALMKEGTVDGLSIGFRADRYRRDKKTGIRQLTKIDLWEISLVTFPMLPQARVIALKRLPKVRATPLRQVWMSRARAVERRIATVARSGVWNS